MNTEDKNIKNEVEENTTKENEQATKESNRVNSETVTHKKKKHGKLIFFLIILIGVLIVLGYMIYTGSWNPFKSNDISKEAKISYEHHTDDAKEILNSAVSEEDVEEIESDTSEQNPFNPNTGISPYGFRVKDYGEKGKNGILIEKQATYDEYYYKFGGYLFIKYMKNSDYANEYFNKKENATSIIDKYDVNNARVVLGYNDHDLHFFILKDCKIYDLVVLEMEYYNNSQNLFNLLEIDYKIPEKDKVLEQK